MGSDFDQERDKKEAVEFGPVKYLWGVNSGRFPNDNSLFIDDDIKAVIDPGSDISVLERINRSSRIDLVLDSHYHYDHIRYNYVFPDAKIMLHEMDAPLFGSLDRIAEAIGLPHLYDQRTVEQWKAQLQGGPAYFRGMYDVAYGQEWIWSTKRIDGSFKDGDLFEFGESEMKVLHTPGHSLGMCCFVFPRQRAAYVTDYDLTPFGPWYGSHHCDMDAIITSAEKLKDLNGIEWFLTSHEMGVFRRNEFMERLEVFLDVIRLREEKILDLLGKKPMTMDELVRSSIVYKSKHVEDKFTYLWEWNHIDMHIKRLFKKNLIELENKRFRIK